MRFRAILSGGFTLFETIVTFGILSALLTLVFAAFGMATGLFQDTEVRQGAENQLRSTKLLLQRDIELSDFWLMSTVARSTPDGDRDALSVSRLSDWNDTARFDAVTDRPIWDRYAVWYASLGTDGSLYRQVLQPSGLVTAPYANLSTNLSDANPESNQNVIYSRVLSDRVQNFRVTSRLQNGTVQINLRMAAEGSRRPNTMTRTRENLELTLIFQPRNTFPRI